MTRRWRVYRLESWLDGRVGETRGGRVSDDLFKYTYGSRQAVRLVLLKQNMETENGLFYLFIIVFTLTTGVLKESCRLLSSLGLLFLHRWWFLAASKAMDGILFSSTLALSVRGPLYTWYSLARVFHIGQLFY